MSNENIIFIFLSVFIGIIAFLLGQKIGANSGKIETASLNTKIEMLEGLTQSLKSDLLSKETSILGLTGQLNSTESERKSLIESIQRHKEEIQAIKDEMTLKFENLANKLLDEKSKKFTEMNTTQIKSFLDPLREQIKDFEKKVEHSYGIERAERGELKGELKKLFDLNQKITTEAENLSKALKGDSKLQGSWGELLLENILEKSGLRKGEEYLTQGGGLALKDDDGRIQKPDIIVRLPDEKHIIVDSKMTLNAYEQYASSEEPSIKDRFAREHIESLKKHIQDLASKKYHANSEIDSPDFTLLFMPLEPAFALAFKLEPQLFQMAWDKQIAVVSPTTLLTTLKTVAAIWKQDKMNRNALDIAKQSGSLYEKFVGLLEDLSVVGQRIEQTQKSYDEVIGKLSNGRGNLLRQVENLKDLGAKTEKSISNTKLGQGLLADKI